MSSRPTTTLHPAGRLPASTTAVGGLQLRDPDRDRTDFVNASTRRLLARYRGLFERLADE